MNNAKGRVNMEIKITKTTMPMQMPPENELGFGKVFTDHMFVMDYDHNAPTAEHLEATHERLFRCIRQAHPNLPIVMMTRPKYRLNDEEKQQAAEKKEAQITAERRYYKVRSGDYLGLIAKRNYTTVSAICRLNGIKADAVLPIGKVLRVK